MNLLNWDLIMRENEVLSATTLFQTATKEPITQRKNQGRNVLFRLALLDLLKLETSPVVPLKLASYPVISLNTIESNMKDIFTGKYSS